MNSVFEKILGEFKFKQEAQELYLEIIKQLFEHGETNRTQAINEITTQIDQQKQRIQKLQDMLVDNKIDPEDYSKMKFRFEGMK